MEVTGKVENRDDLNPVIPVWFQFKPRWYRRLKTIADECGVTMAEVVGGGVELFLREHRHRLEDKQRPEPSRRKSTSSNKAGAELVKQRWQKTSPEERSEVGRALAEKRWQKKQNPNRAA